MKFSYCKLLVVEFLVSLGITLYIQHNYLVQKKTLYFDNL